MRRNQGLLLSLGCLLALAGACDDGGSSGTPTAGTTGNTAGTAPTGGTKVPEAGSTGGTVTAGNGTGNAGSRAMGTAGSTAGAAGTTTANAGMSGGAAGSSPASTEGFAMCGKPAKEGTCKDKAPGIYGLKTEVDVWYMDENNAQPVFDPGRGKITIYFKGTLGDLCEDGSGGKAQMQACGTRLPPLYADLNGGVIQITFPDEMWDKPGMPVYPATGSSTGFNPGDTLTIDPTAGLLGIDLGPEGAAATFPGYMQTTTFACTDGKTGADCFPDQDGDGNPGVTVKMQLEGTPPDPGYQSISAWHYIPAPISLGSGAFEMGAETVYIGLRTSLGGSGLIGSDCMSGSGAAVAEDFISRVFACVMNDGMPCSETGGETDGVGFLDKNTPTFYVLKPGDVPPEKWKHARAEVDSLLDRTPGKGPQSSMVRIADLGSEVSCADVRNAAYPAPATN